MHVDFLRWTCLREKGRWQTAGERDWRPRVRVLFFFLFILQQHFLKQCHLRWSWKKTINSALTRRLFSCAQSWFLFGRNIFHLHPRHHICFGNRSGAVPCHLNYEINWWCDLFSFSKAEGVIERTKEEEKHRRDSKICCVKLYAKKKAIITATSFSTQQRKFLIFSCVCCSVWYVFLMYSRDLNS